LVTDLIKNSLLSSLSQIGTPRVFCAPPSPPYRNVERGGKIRPNQPTSPKANKNKILYDIRLPTLAEIQGVAKCGGVLRRFPIRLGSQCKKGKEGTPPCELSYPGQNNPPKPEMGGEIKGGGKGNWENPKAFVEKEACSNCR